MRRAFAIVLFVTWAGCTCARLDDGLVFRCDPDSGDDCPADSGTVDAGPSDAGMEDAGVSDAGTNAGHDAGTDAGLDGGRDGGCTTSTNTELCGNGLDDDCDEEIDCADRDCMGFACDDLDTCTTNDRCVAGGGCRGGRSGNLIAQCVTTLGTTILADGVDCPTFICPGVVVGMPIYRRIPAPIPDRTFVFSTRIQADGGCDTPNQDQCRTWYVRGTDITDAGFCFANDLEGVWSPVASSLPPPGTLPFYQYRLDGGGHTFGTSATAPGGTTLDPPGPAFYACPL